jgi:inosine-uridine nucleoside N-ribohydrolase
VRLAALGAMLLVASGCARRGVILDHDGGIDDYVAMVMVLASGERDVRGVTVEFGDSYPDQAVEATDRVLAQYGARVPVGECGPALRGKNEFPAAWRARSAAVAKLPAFAGPARTQRADDAVAMLRRALAAQRLGTVDVLATGPLTNIAAVLHASPELVGRIGRLVIMGGAIRVAGNAPGGGEYNIYVDPEAAEFVFSLAGRGLRIELAPLDATNQLPVTLAFLERLLASSATPARQAGQILNLARDEIASGTEGRPQYYLWDGGAALALLRPDLFSFATLRLQVTPEGRTIEAANGHGPIRVALGARQEARPMEQVFGLLSRRRR